MERGLSQSSIQVMRQGPEGYLWIGTQFGLDRFDGHRFRGWQAGGGPDDLHHGFVQSLLFDRAGDLWIGTNYGLNRMNPATGQIRKYDLPKIRHNQRMFGFARHSLLEDDAGNIIAATNFGPTLWRRDSDRLERIQIEQRPNIPASMRLLRDRLGTIWLATRTSLWRYQQDRERFQLIHRAQVPQTFTNADTIITALREGGVAYASADGLHVLDSDGNKIRSWRATEIDPQASQIDGVASDPHDALWVSTPQMILRSKGPHWHDWQPMLDTRIVDDLPHKYLQQIDLAQTPDRRLWVAGNFGVGVLEPGRDRLTVLQHDPDDPHSLPPTLAELGYHLLVDRFGVLWVGTNLGGLAKLRPQASRFVHVQDNRPTIRSRNIVRAITEQQTDGQEWVWVSHQGTGLGVWKRNDEGIYKFEAEYSQSLGTLPDNDTRALITQPDHEAVWILGSNWIAHSERPGQPVQQVLEGVESARTALFDQQQNLWIGAGYTLTEYGINADRQPSPLRRFELADIEHYLPLQIYSLCIPNHEASPDGENANILVGGHGGLARVNLQSGSVRRIQPGGAVSSHPGNWIFDLYCADNGTVWFGTRGAGLGEMRLDADGQTHLRFHSTDQGLADSTIYGILPGPSGELWLSSNAGILRFDPETGATDQFGPDDGVQGHEFNHSVAHIGASRRYYFGGVNGWNVFEPSSIKRLPNAPIVHVDTIRVNDRPVTAAAAEHAGIELAHDQNRIEIEYIGLHFANPEQVRYAYRLAGLDSDWIDAGTNRLARYASVPPGDYRFEVKAANPDGVWSAPASLLQFTIRKPPWNTPWAWATYAISILMVVWWLTRRHQARERALQKLVNQRTAELRNQHRTVERQADELRQALEARTTLFANISHEFRTPLTLISAALDRLEPNAQPEPLALGRRYLVRLLRLVEQLLDLSRLKASKPLPTSAPWRLDRLVSQTVHAFESVARQHAIALDLEIRGHWQTRCPADLVEKILLNLLTNAIKYTPAGGQVEVRLDPVDEGVRLSVSDTGPGIPESEQQAVFERFYRTESAEHATGNGAGIGLALVKEAVAALGGRLTLESAPGEGSAFIIRLPATRCAEDAGDQTGTLDPGRRRLDLEALSAPTRSAREKNALTPPASDTHGTVLVVEDNEDLRHWICATLSSDWKVLDAADGKRGLEQARRHAPDLVVSDLMMPVMDGFDLLRALREDIETSHIPVLFLTARQDDETRLEAFRLNADAFLPKPFRVDELRARLDQMIAGRRRMQQHLLRSDRLGDSPPGSGGAEDERETRAIESANSVQLDRELMNRDRDLLQRIEDWLDQNFHDPEADIDSMAAAVYLSPRTLQRKLKALTGRSPAQLLRKRRLEHAVEQLQNTEQSVLEIAHDCGFSSSQYFSRVFRQEYGKSPGQWREQAVRGQP